LATQTWHYGWTVTIPSQPLWCGLTWISTGQLDVVKRILRRSPLTLRRDGRAETTSMNSTPTCGLATTLPGWGALLSVMAVLRSLCPP
jgi:hypothetical protein